MLVTFSCKQYENITMFGEVAKTLITMMGQSGAIPGAILAKDVPTALSCLKKNLEGQKQKDSVAKQDDDEEEPRISLAHRAIPLIAMLEAASKHQSNIMWI